MQLIGFDSPPNVKNCLDHLDQLEKDVAWRKRALIITCVSCAILAAVGIALATLLLSPIALLPFLFVVVLIGVVFEGPVLWAIDKMVTRLFKVAPKQCMRDVVIARNAAQHLETLKNTPIHELQQFFSRHQIQRTIDPDKDLPLIACYRETMRQLLSEILPFCSSQTEDSAWYLLKKGILVIHETAKILCELKGTTSEHICTMTISLDVSGGGGENLELGEDPTDFHTKNQEKLPSSYQLRLDHVRLHFSEEGQPVPFSEIFPVTRISEEGITNLSMRLDSTASISV